MSNNIGRRHGAPANPLRITHRELSENRTKTHRVHSLQSELEKKKFAQEYSKITTEFKNILGNRKNRLKRATEMRYHQNSSKKGFSASHAEKVLLRNGDPTDSESTSGKLMMGSKTKIGFHHHKTDSTTRFIGSANPDLFIHLQEEKQKKINLEFGYVRELLAHFENLFRIREDLDDCRNNYESIIKSVKKYIFDHDGASVSRLDQLLKIQVERKRLRGLLCMERIVVIGVMDSLIRECDTAIENEGKSTLDTIIGVYYSILGFIAEERMGEQHKSRICRLVRLLDELEYQKRKDLRSTNDYINKKISGLFRYNQSLMEKVKEVLHEAKEEQYKVNKAFYHLLCEYARNLNESELLTWNRNLLDSLATCPSPHLPFTRFKGNLTVVIQFQGVLGIVTKLNSKKHLIKLRPFAEQVISNLKKVYEVILFTCLLPEQFGEPCQLFSIANAVLFKYHAVRYKGTLVKDISRLGRRPQEVILLDDQPSRNTLAVNKQNTLIVDSWKGNPEDQELLHAESVLASIASVNPQDVRTVIGQHQLKTQRRQGLANLPEEGKQEEEDDDEEVQIGKEEANNQDLNKQQQADVDIEKDIFGSIELKNPHTSRLAKKQSVVHAHIKKQSKLHIDLGREEDEDDEP